MRGLSQNWGFIRLSSVFIFVSLSGLTNTWAQSTTSRTATIPIPNKVNSIKKPASDLVKDGAILDVGEAAKMAENGFDLSNLDPVENKLWQNQSYPASDALSRGYPQAGMGVQFLSFEASTKFTSMMRVQSLQDPSKYFRLAISRYSQSMMMRAALLRKLGYFIPSPKYYTNLKITFVSEDEKKAFIDQAEMDAGDFESRKWITANNTSDHSLILASATLEEMSSEYFDANWGLAPNPDDPNQVSTVQRFSRNRSFRALIFPYSLVDVPESVNRYSTKFASVSTGFISISYFMAQSFQACAYDDAQWMLKRVQKLSLKDMQEIVAEAQYPQEIAELVLAKFVNRTINALQTFGLKSDLPALNLNITSNSGLVTKGKVTAEWVPGYPQRFSHGERTSPYQEGDLARYLSIDGKSSLLATVLAKINNQLQLLSVEDAASAYQRDYIKKVVEHIQTKPHEPFNREITSWGGPLFGFNITASRHIATGTYTDSTAPVQLVDNINVGAGLGLFRAVDGIDQVLPIAGANISASRDYTHVRPILSVKEATGVNWKNLVIPAYMKNISQVLEAAEKKAADGTSQSSLDAFLNDLRDGEVFTITDSVALSSYLQASASIDVLLGFQPFNFINSITIGGDASRVILRQVSFHRVINDRLNGVHVYVRDMKNKARGLEMNVNFFLNLLKVRSQMTEADIQTDGFLIDYNPTLAAQIDPQSEAGKKLAATGINLRKALLPLFRDNDTELLYSKFANKKFKIEHEIKSVETMQKILAWKFSQFREDHLLNITYPRSEQHPELDPEDEKVTLFSAKRGELKGRDILGFLVDIVEGVFTNKVKNDVKIARNTNENPADAPMGKAYWRFINTESDLSKIPDGSDLTQYPSVGTIQHVWGGWSLKRDKFFKVLDEVKKQFEGTAAAKYELVNRNEFMNMKSLDFYRITGSVSILGPGLDKITEMLIQSDMDDKNPSRPKNWLNRVINKVKCGSVKCTEKIRYENDKAFYRELMTLIGNGDFKRGESAYIDRCQKQTSPNQAPGPRGGLTRDWSRSYEGNKYKCLSPWLVKLMKAAREYPEEDRMEQTRWMTQVLNILDKEIPIPSLLNYLGQENYVLLVRINGFRSGDEDGDIEYFSNSVGDPNQNYEYAGGLVNLFVRKTGIMPTELNRTIGGFQ